MKNLHKKKVSILGKEISVVLIAMIAVMGVTTAALLPYFGQITGMATVSQSVTLDGEEYDESSMTGAWETSLVAGESVVDCSDGEGYSLKNNAGEEVTVQFETTCENSEGQDNGVRTSTLIDWSDEGNERCDGIQTEIYGTLELTEKNVDFETSPWTIPNNAEKATVKYTIVGDSFSAEVIEGEQTDYELVYYSDNFGGRFDNPAQAVKISSVDESLPYSEDANLDEYSYCTEGTEGEDYEHCHGAKIWYVPTSALDGCSGGVCDIDWNQADDFLFETDLISYTKTGSNEMTLPANGGGFNFCVKNDFAINLVPEEYTVTSKIVPVTAE